MNDVGWYLIYNSGFADPDTEENKHYIPLDISDPCEYEKAKEEFKKQLPLISRKEANRGNECRNAVLRWGDEPVKL